MIQKFKVASVWDICNIKKAAGEFSKLDQTSCDAVCESHYIPMNFL